MLGLGLVSVQGLLFWLLCRMGGSKMGGGGHCLRCVGASASERVLILTSTFAAYVQL